MSVAKYKRQWEQRKLCVLVDVDQVVADFEGSFYDNFKEKHTEEPDISLDNREEFYISRQYEKMKPGLGVKVQEIINSKGFFLNLPPIPGAIDAVKEMSSMDNVEVFLCTSPIKNYAHCVTEKFQWVEKHFGRDWTERLIITRDKTVVRGDILIDDKPKITGALKPSWKHVLFAACHNRKEKHHQILQGWNPQKEWKELIEAELMML